MIQDYFRGWADVRMIQGTSPDVERKIIAILKILSESSEALGSAIIARELERYGISLSERAVRYHLRITDERGYTQPLGRDGRKITPQGLDELKMALAPEQVGFILDKLQMLAFETTFDAAKKEGKVPVNASLISKDRFKEALSVMKAVFESGLCVSELVAIAYEGEKLGSVVVPAGKIALATVCSVIINGTFLKAGIPTNSKFGGVLEIRGYKPRRFVAIINYSGTSLDPSEQYIRAGMTSVLKAATTGDGMILANFREIPASARAEAEEKIAALRRAGIGGVYIIGNTSEPVCQAPVSLNRVGMVLLGGLNPIAAAVESGIEIDSVAESGLVDYQQLVSFRQL